MKKDPEVPSTVMKLIDMVLDEDIQYAPGSAEKAANELAERALKVGREKQLKDAMRFWKNAHGIPEDVLWQWFTGVFRGLKKRKKSNEGRNQYKPRRRRRTKDKD